MKNWSTKEWFVFTSIFAFASIISFFQIDSYWADQNDFNGIIGWLGIGIATGLVSIFGLYKASKK
jgi:hypothetical protein